MRYIAGREKDSSFTGESLQNFSCPALREIDALWYSYPKRPNHFGFRVQKEIWQKNGSPTDNWPKFQKNWNKFYIEVGWKTEESGIEDDSGYVPYELTWNKDMRNGNLPRGSNISVITSNCPWLCRAAQQFLFSRCELQPLRYSE